MSGTYKRFTVEDARNVMDAHAVALDHGDFGFNGHRPRQGCALSMLALREAGSIEDAHKLIYGKSTLPATDVAEATGIPFDYLRGLEWGFDFPDSRYKCTTQDAIDGFADGQALRSLCPPSTT
jgi:hypothetical protein